MDEQTMKKEGQRRSKWPIILLAAIIIVLLGIIAALMLDRNDENDHGQQTPPTATPIVTPTPTPGTTLQIDPNAGALITPTPAPQEPGVAIPGWGRMTIPAGATEVRTSMQNPEANEGWYYLTFELRLKETNEVLFTTGLIPPGQYCNAVTLTRALDPGEYAAIIHVQPYRISDQSPTNNADMETVLIVK